MSLFHPPICQDAIIWFCSTKEDMSCFPRPYSCIYIIRAAWLCHLFVSVFRFTHFKMYVYICIGKQVVTSLFTWFLLGSVFLLSLNLRTSRWKINVIVCPCLFSSASPVLSWRDVQHIIVKTSKPGHLSAPDWKTNAAGYNGTHTNAHTLTYYQFYTPTILFWRPLFYLF